MGELVVVNCFLFSIFEVLGTTATVTAIHGSRCELLPF